MISCKFQQTSPRELDYIIQLCWNTETFNQFDFDYSLHHKCIICAFSSTPHQARQRGVIASMATHINAGVLDGQNPTPRELYRTLPQRFFSLLLFAQSTYFV